MYCAKPPSSPAKKKYVSRYAARPGRFAASLCTIALIMSKRCVCVGVARDGQPDPDEVRAVPRDRVHHRPPPGAGTRPASSGCRRCRPRVPSGSPVMKSWSSLPPNMSTTAPRLSFERISSRDVREPVEDVRALEPGRDPAVDLAGGRDRAVARRRAEERLAGNDDERVAGDPDAELALRRELLALRRRGRACRRVGLPRERGATRRRCRSRRRRERPSAALSARRGRSSRSAPLTLSSGPVTSSASVALPALGLDRRGLVQARARSGGRAMRSPTSETTIAEPAECRRLPPSPVRGRGFRLRGLVSRPSIRTGSR